MATSRSHTGQCLCGSVRFKIAGPLRSVVVCHCAKCRQWHGGPGSYTSVAREAMTLLNSEDLAWYQSSARARRGFCRHCGSSLFWEQVGGGDVGIAAGAIDPPTGLTTVQHIYTGEKSDYYAISDGLPCRDRALDVQYTRYSKSD